MLCVPALFESPLLRVPQPLCTPIDMPRMNGPTVALAPHCVPALPQPLAEWVPKFSPPNAGP